MYRAAVGIMNVLRKKSLLVKPFQKYPVRMRRRKRVPSTASLGYGLCLYYLLMTSHFTQTKKKFPGEQCS